MSLDNKIQNFWAWFSEHEADLLKAIEAEAVTEFYVNALDDFILDMGKFSWEIGPGSHEHWNLIISPNGDRDLLSISQMIVTNAPVLNNWEFHSCKPAKDWDKVFSVYDDLMHEHEIDASDWNYVVLKLKDQKVELILEAKNIDHLDEYTAKTAAEILVEGELGEELRMNQIALIDIVSELDSMYQSRKMGINNLRKHFLEY